MFRSRCSVVAIQKEDRNNRYPQEKEGRVNRNYERERDFDERAREGDRMYNDNRDDRDRNRNRERERDRDQQRFQERPQRVDPDRGAFRDNKQDRNGRDRERDRINYREDDRQPPREKQDRYGRDREPRGFESPQQQYGRPRQNERDFDRGRRHDASDDSNSFEEERRRPEPKNNWSEGRDRARGKPQQVPDDYEDERNWRAEKETRSQGKKHDNPSAFRKQQQPADERRNGRNEFSTTPPSGNNAIDDSPSYDDSSEISEDGPYAQALEIRKLKEERKKNTEYREIEDYVYYLIRSGTLFLCITSVSHSPGKIKKEVMYCLTFGTYCFHQKSGITIPCEIGLTEFTLGDGEKSSYSQLIHPGEGVPDIYEVCF